MKKGTKITIIVLGIIVLAFVVDYIFTKKRLKNAKEQLESGKKNTANAIKLCKEKTGLEIILT